MKKLFLFLLLSLSLFLRAEAQHNNLFIPPANRLSDGNNGLDFEQKAKSGKYHTGLDYCFDSDVCKEYTGTRCSNTSGLNFNELIKASGSGRIYKKYVCGGTGNDDDHGFGNTIIMIHKVNNTEIYTLYGHLDRFTPNLNVGDYISVGTILGYKGMTGSGSNKIPHLHFEIKNFGELAIGSNYGYYTDKSMIATNGHYNPFDYFYKVDKKFLDLSVESKLTTINGNNGINYSAIINNPFTQSCGVNARLAIEFCDNASGDYRVITLPQSISLTSGMNNLTFQSSQIIPKGFYKLRIEIKHPNSNEWYVVPPGANGENGNTLVVHSNGDYPDFKDPIYNSKSSKLNSNYTYIKRGLEYGLFNGSCGAFNPNAVLERGQAAKVLVATGIKLGIFQINISTANGKFTDVDTWHEYFPYIQTLRNNNLINTSNSSYDPNRGITYGEFCKMAVDVLGLQNSLNLAQLRGYISGNSLSSISGSFYKKWIEDLYKIVLLKNGSPEKILDLPKSASQVDLAINRATMAKILVNAYEFKLLPQGQSLRATNILSLSSYSIIGNKLENNPGLYGNEIPEHIFSINQPSLTLISGQSTNISFNTSSIQGNPLHFYWTTDDGTITTLPNFGNFQSIKFTAPIVTTQTTIHLYSYAAHDGGFFREWYKDIIVNPTGTPPSTGGVTMQLSASTLDFGSIAVNTTTDRTLTITNPSTSTGSLVGGFNMQSGTAFNVLTGSPTFNLLPGQSTTYTFRFQPTAGGGFSLPFLINNNSSNYSTPTSINLSGNATVSSSGGGSLSCASATAITCGNIVSGTTTGGTNQASNYGSLSFIFNGPEKVYSFIPTASGPHKIEFTGDNLGKMRVFILTNCGNTSTYTADVSGVEWVNLNSGFIYYFVVDGFDNTAGNFSIKVSNCPNTSGSAFNNCIASSHSSIDYGLEMTGSTREASFTIRNRTGNYLEFTFSITGPDASLFSISSSNTYLNGLETKTYTVYWTANPNGSAYQRAVLNVSTANCATPVKINLQGKVVPTFNFTRPVGGEIFYLGADPDNIISWTTDAGATQYDTEYSLDGGITWIPNGSIYNSSSDTYVFGENDCTTKGKIRMRLPLTETWFESSGVFTIRQKRYTELMFLTTPVGREIFKGGQTVRIAWEDYFNFGLSKTVKVSYDGGTTYQVIASGLNQNYFDWTVPYLANNNTNCYILVSDGSHEDANNCSFSIAATTPPALNYTYTMTQPSCSTSSNGVINLNPSGGTTPYSYVWKKNNVTVGSNNYTLSGVGVGDYEFTITDASGNFKVGNISLSANNFGISYTTTNATCTKNDGSATVTTSPSGSYTYNWGGGVTGATITNKQAGNYTVTVTNTSSGCSQVQEVYIPSITSPVNLSFNSPSTLCYGQTTNISVTPSGGTSGYTYQWSNNAITQTANVSSGQYWAGVTDANGCIGIGNITVNQHAILSAQYANQNPQCGVNNGSITVTPLGGTGTPSILWNTGSTSFSLADIGAGNYTYTVSDANCSVTQTLSVIADDVIPSLSASSISIIEGQNIALTATGCQSGATVKWSNNQSGNVINIAPTSTGTYSARCELGVNCIGEYSDNITINVCKNILNLSGGSNSNERIAVIINSNENPLQNGKNTYKFDKSVQLNPPFQIQANANKTFETQKGGCGLQQGLVAHYTLDGDTQDKSPYENHLSNINATLTTDRKGQANKAYYFNGNAKLISDNVSYLYNTSFTISYWIKPDVYTGQMFIRSGPPATNGALHIALRNANTYTFAFYSNDYDITNFKKDNQWHHYTLIYDKVLGTRKIFEDGILLGSQTCNSALFAQNTPLILGYSWADNYTDHLVGKLDDLRIYNRTLNDTEVSQIYNSEK